MPRRRHRSKSLLGPSVRKFQPKLRMVANGSERVNAVRAEYAGPVAVESQRVLNEVSTQRTEQEAAPVARSKAKRGKLKTLSNNVLTSVFVRTDSPSADLSAIKRPTARKGNLATATVPLRQLPSIANLPHVTHVELAESLADPRPIVSGDRVGAPQPRRVTGSRAHHDGQGVLVGIIDVQGFDFTHKDFLDADGKTRFVRIWDQGGNTRPPPGSRYGSAEFAYGAELDAAHLNTALTNAAREGLPAYELERQSQMAVGSHGTHVASIAAGNRGLCSNAMIAGVLISLPEDDLDRRRSFYDSSRVAHAFDYLLAVAADVKARALVVNISLGTNGHAHDASSAISRWIDAELTVPGRAVCVAAGNAGQEVAEFEGDSGWVMGRIHTSGRVGSRGLASDIEWVVVGNGLADVSENELEIWYSPQDRFTVRVKPPGGEWAEAVAPRQFIENRRLDDGTMLSVYNELYHPANGANHISVFLSPFFAPDAVVGVKAGTWIVRIEGEEVKDGRYHGWIERDDPRPVGRIGTQEFWNFPSFFSTRSNVDASSVSTLACGQRILSVANLDLSGQRINRSSSQGPTRDGRFKPDVAAPGTDIVAAKGFAEPGDEWIAMTGTSMASPHVAGVVGLMLAIEPQLTAAQIEGIVQRTAQPLPGAAGYSWLDDAGYGVINPQACLDEAARANERQDLTGQ